jgi:hypothetical protein
MLIIIIAVIGVVGNIEYKAELAMDKALTTKEHKIAEVLIKHGAENPVELAQVIAKKKRPRLATAQAIVESNGRNVIGKAGEKGIWQIIERDHGIVPDDIQGQADKWEEVFESYLNESKGKMKEALCRYNSGRPNRSIKYANKVMAKVEEVKL